MSDRDNTVYLDYAATTPAAPEVVDAIQQALGGDWARQSNASAAHYPGAEVARCIAVHQATVAAWLNASPDEIVWTSGATESNNLALKGAVDFLAGLPGHIVSSRVEHKSVVDTLRWLESRGTRITWLTPGVDGRIDPADVAAAITADTTLVSLMHINNETGAINDIAGIGAVTREHGVMFHVDAAQSAGRLPIDVESMHIDLLSLSAHKFYGPKGIGVLYVRRRPLARMAPQMHGGGQQRGLRSGTLPLHQIAGMAAAVDLATTSQLDADRAHAATLNGRMRQHLQAITGLTFNSGDGLSADATHWPGILNISVDGVDGESLHALMPGLAVSRGSACTAAAVEPSYVLRALGRSDALADASVRFSFGRPTSIDEIDQAAVSFVEAITTLRSLASGRAVATTTGVDGQQIEAQKASGLPRLGLEIPGINPHIIKYFGDHRHWLSERKTVKAVSSTDSEGAVVPYSGQASTPASRAELTIELIVDDRRDGASGQAATERYIQSAAFSAMGCVATVASAAWLCERIEGRTTAEAQSICAADVVDALQMPMTRRYCAVMAVEAVAQALARAEQAATEVS